MPVLGKRTRNTSPSPVSPTTRILTRRRAAAAAANQQRDLLTPEPTPNPKRPRPSSSIVLTPFDDGSNKENIPPQPIDLIVSRPRTQQRVLPPPQLSPPATPVINHATRSRAALRAQNHDDASTLIGRDKERDKIQKFLNPILTDAVNNDDFDSPVGLYISGAPGTGKTALINELISSISTSHGSSVRVISINCMALEDRDLNGVWERCAQELHIPRNAKRTSLLKGDWPKQFCKLFDDKKCLLVLDEIDNLVSPACSVSDIFDIAAGSTAVTRPRIIGISNTHTLTNAKPIRGVETLHFEPYTAAQMKAVLTSRLGTISTDSSSFPIPTIALLCMKVASQTGDIRMLFSVARRALDLAIQGTQTPDMPTVNPAHVLTALKVCNASHQGKSGNETVTRVRNLGLQARFALASLLIASRRLTSGLSLTSNHNHPSSPNSNKLMKKKENTASVPISLMDVTTLHGFYTSILGTGAFLGLGRTEFVDLINLLEGNGLVQLDASRKGKSKGVQTVSIARDVREEELIRGLIGNEGAQLDVKEEEVGHLWHREIARIEREMKSKATSHHKESYFKDAEED